MKKRKPLSKLYLILVIIFLYAPIFTLMVLSFNGGKSMGKWYGFSGMWYAELFQDEEIMSALFNTVIIALISAIASTIIGTAISIALPGMNRKVRNTMLAFNNIPLLNADIVTGLSLMLMFVAFGISLSMGTVIIAHITFCIPYVILNVRPRVMQFGRTQVEAALDLGATKTQALFKVVLPELRPAIFSGFLMAFTMSVDDFIVTHFTRGAGVDTLSTLIYGQSKIGIRPTIYALSTIIFVIVFIVLVIRNILIDKGISEETIVVKKDANEKGGMA